MVQHRKVVGVVTQIRLRGSLPAATLKPLAVSSADLSSWELDLTEGPRPATQFPNAGKVSWLHPDAVEKGSVWEFSVKEQPSYDDAPDDPIRDRYMVEPESTRQCFPVLDLASLGDEQIGRRTLTELGVTLSAEVPRSYYIRTEGNLWSSSEVELTPKGVASPDSYVMQIPNDGITRWAEWIPQVEPFELACDSLSLSTSFRWLLLAPGNTPTGPTRLRDWSADGKVLQHLLRTLRKCDSDFAQKMDLTDASIRQIANVLSNGAEGISNPGLEMARLHRVKEYIKSLQAGADAARVAMSVIEDSPLADVIERQKVEILKEERKTARTRAEKELQSERTELERIRKLTEDGQKKFDQLANQYEATRAKREEQIEDLEDNLSERLADVLENAEEVVASSALIRAITGSGAQRTRAARGPRAQGLASALELEDQKAALDQLRRALVNQDVPHHVAEPLFAGFLSDVVPILSGPRGFAALSAFANCTTGGRIEWIPVSPGWLDPSDFVGKPPGEDRNHPCGLLEVLINAQNSDCLHLVVLDGINVAPSETILPPLFACYSDAAAGYKSARALPIVDARDPAVSRVQWPSNVLLAATSNPAGQFPIHSSAWDSAFYLCCDAVCDAALIASNDEHPDKRSARTAETASVVRAATWSEWKRQGQDRPLAKCADLLAQTEELPNISRPARDSVLRFFAASCGTKGAAPALLDATAFALLPHVVDDGPGRGRFLEGKTPDYYNNQVAVSEFLILNGMS